MSGGRQQILDKEWMTQKEGVVNLLWIKKLNENKNGFHNFM